MELEIEGSTEDQAAVCWGTWESVDRSDWWWYWNGDPCCAANPVWLVRSGDEFWASAGQLGWRCPRSISDMGGQWMKIIEPGIPIVE
jgi:hypothetical protein